MAAPNPKEMLALYEQHSTAEVAEQVEMIAALDTKDALRLLAYQVFHVTQAHQAASGAPTMSAEKAARLLRNGRN